MMHDLSVEHFLFEITVNYLRFKIYQEWKFLKNVHEEDLKGTSSVSTDLLQKYSIKCVYPMKQSANNSVT